MRTAKNYIEDIMYGRRAAPFWSLFLRLISIIYRLLLRLRGFAYDTGFLERKKIKPFVISIGNITVGGTGKTPAVISIAQFLKKSGSNPVVISRGYGRRDESAIITVSDGVRMLTDAESGGDEPVLIAEKTKNIPVVVGSDRWEAALIARDLFPVDTVILDDGFQHIRLHRDLDIVLVDARRPFGNYRLFPAGILREPLSSLSRAHIVLITGSDRVPELEALKHEIGQYTEADIFTSCHIPVDVEAAATGERLHLSTLQGTKVLAFCGIARPQSFLEMLGVLGAEVISESLFPDHYQYSASDLDIIFKTAAAKGINMIITTEKDIMRLRGLNTTGIWALRIELKINENNGWETVLLKRA